MFVTNKNVAFYNENFELYVQSLAFEPKIFKFNQE